MGGGGEHARRIGTPEVKTMSESSALFKSRRFGLLALTAVSSGDACTGMLYFERNARVVFFILK